MSVLSLDQEIPQFKKLFPEELEFGEKVKKRKTVENSPTKLNGSLVYLR